MKKIYIITVFVLLFLLVASGCTLGATTSEEQVPQESAQAESSSEPAKTEPTDILTVKVGTMGTYEPFTYTDDDGRLTGYDIEVLRLIESVDPTLKFDFQTAPWDALFPGLDSDKYQILANQITSNPDREAKYLLTDNTYALYASCMVVTLKTICTMLKSVSNLPEETEKKSQRYCLQNPVLSVLMRSIRFTTILTPMR